MSMSACQVAIIGAGPYGLAAAAYLRSRLETRVFGEPMEFWRKQMPAGMFLRSSWDASHIADPDDALTLDAYQKDQGLHLPRPIPLQHFVNYGQWFQRQVAPDLDTRRLVRIEPLDKVFRLVTTDGESMEAQRVIVAAGIAPFAYRPFVFEALPKSFVSHSADHHDLTCFRGRRVLVVGGGQSAIESAALLDEGGADVELVVRRERVRWLQRSAWLHRRLKPLRRILYHRTDVGPPGLNQIVGRPDWFRRLPLEWQRRVAERSIRPAGAAWLIPRVQGVRFTTGHHVVSATATEKELCIAFDDGSKRCVDHVLLATGYRVDISRYAFLSPKLTRSLRRSDGYPQFRRGFESSVPGLYFVGASAEGTFGPVMRFVSGTQYASRSLVRAITGNGAGDSYRKKHSWVATAGQQS